METGLSATPNFYDGRKNTSVISQSKSLTYKTLHTQLEELGIQAGYPQTITPYTFQRGAATYIDQIASETQANLVLGHRDKRYREAYVSRIVTLGSQEVMMGVTPTGNLLP